MHVARLAADGLFDNLGQLGRRGDRGGVARGHDELRDATRFAFFAKGIEQIGQRLDIERIDQIGGALPLPAHAHVERAFAHEGKAALGLVELHRGHPDIEHHPIDGAMLGRERIEFGKSAGHEHEATFIFGHQRVGKFLHAGVAVDTDDDGARFEQRARIAARAKRAVDNALAGQRLKRGEHLVQQDRDVGTSIGAGFGHGTLAHRVRLLHCRHGAGLVNCRHIAQ